MTNQYHAFTIDNKGRYWEGMLDNRAAAFRVYQSALKNPRCVRCGVYLYDTETDLFAPHWETLVDSVKGLSS